MLSNGAVWLNKENKYSWNGHTVQICYGGLKVRDTKFQDPTNIVPGLVVIDLPRLLAMKTEGGMNQHRHRTDFIKFCRCYGLNYRNWQWYYTTKRRKNYDGNTICW